MEKSTEGIRMASSSIPATINTPVKDGQNSRRVSGLGSGSRSSPRRGNNMTSANSSNSLSSDVPASLPPLHPKQSSNNALPFLRTRTNSDNDTDSVSVMSTGSSIVPVDAGQHGFITYNDDASSTGSLVLAYEQGKDVPPAAYDLPAAIFNVYNQNNNNNGNDQLLGEGLVPSASCNSLSVNAPYSVSSETDSLQLLPYHVRTKLTASRQNSINSDEVDAILAPNGKATNQQQQQEQQQLQQQQHRNGGYGSIEEGLAPPTGYYGNTSVVQTYNPSINSYEHTYNSSSPMCAPYEDPYIKYDNCQNNSSSVPEQSSNTVVYVSMLIALTLFVITVYALFYIMKMMPSNH